MREIPLTQGKVAIVDDEDYQWLSSIRWCASRKGPYATGRVAFYAKRGGRKQTYMHRLITEASSGQEVDHIDGDGLNNRRENLRICSRQENSMNMGHRAAGSKKTSKFKGVRRHSSRKWWQAQIKHNYKWVYIGNFATELEAAAAYDAKARELFGEFARPNFPTGA